MTKDRDLGRTSARTCRRFEEILDPPDNSFLRVCKLVRVCKPCISAQRAQTMFFLLVPIA